MEKSRSVLMVAMVALGLVAGNGLAAAEDNPQNSSSTQSHKGSMGTQKGKMGETERAVPKTGQSSQSGKMNAPNGTRE
jgi:hypothetical protein